MIYITPVWKGWVLELFYGFRFRPIFSSKWPLNSSRDYLNIYAFLSLIRYLTAKIMSFHDFFVTFQNHDFWALFWPYWKRDEPDIVFGDAKTLSLMLSKNYKVNWGRWYRITCLYVSFKLFYKNGMGFDMILRLYNCSLVCILVNRPLKLVIMAHCKNVFVKLCEKKAEISQTISKNRL